MNKSIKDILIGFFMLLLVIFFTFFTYFSINNNFLQVIGSYIDDNLLYKQLYSTWTHNDEIIIIKIDDKTLNALQEGDLRMLGFSKKTYADVIENLFEKYRVDILGIDIVFSNRSIIGENDEKKLEDVFLKYQDRLVLSTRGDNKYIPLCRYSNIQHGASEWVIENRIRKFGIFYPGYDIENSCSDYTIYKGNKGGILGFPIEIYKKYLINTYKNNGLEHNLSDLQNVLDKNIEYNDGNIYSRFFTNGKQNSGTMGFKSYSFMDILNNKKIDSDGNKIDLEGKIVLLGEVGTLLHDRQFSPVDFDKQVSGVEFHANGILTMMAKEYLYKINKIYIFITLVLTIIILFLIIFKTKTIIGILSLFGLFLVHLSLGFELFSRGFIYPVFFFIYSLLIGFVVIYLYKYVTIDKQKGFIKKAFGMFLSPEMVEIISEDPSKLNLKGEKGYLTVFFSDIEGFTSISEKISANELFDFLNEYFSTMTEILTNNKGTLDKYIGDSIMGFFNAPLKIKNHEFLACKTAIEQQRKLKELNEKWNKDGIINFRIRIGINSGNLIHGNLGSKKNRINYTVIGDNVNLASRLEGVNKQYGTSIIISESTYLKIKDSFITRELDTIKVKGKSNKTKIYELIGFNGEIFNENIIKNYENALDFYYSGDYKSAIIEFEKNKNDTPSEKMIERCIDLLNGKLKVTDGVFIMNSK